jgi:hypothetical protein
MWNSIRHAPSQTNVLAYLTQIEDLSFNEVEYYRELARNAPDRIMQLPAWLTHVVSLLNTTRLQEYQKETERSIAQLCEYQIEIERLNGCLTAIYSSTSWRITEPLRRLRKLLQGSISLW